MLGVERHVRGVREEHAEHADLHRDGRLCEHRDAALAAHPAAGEAGGEVARARVDLRVRRRLHLVVAAGRACSVVDREGEGGEHVLSAFRSGTAAPGVERGAIRGREHGGVDEARRGIARGERRDERTEPPAERGEAPGREGPGAPEPLETDAPVRLEADAEREVDLRPIRDALVHRRRHAVERQGRRRLVEEEHDVRRRLRRRLVRHRELVQGAADDGADVAHDVARGARLVDGEVERRVAHEGADGGREGRVRGASSGVPTRPRARRRGGRAAPRRP